MPRPTKNEHLVEFAKRGAQAQLSDLLHEIKLLVGMFPHLKDTVDKGDLPISFLLKKGARSAEKAVARLKGVADMPARKKTRTLSAAARRAISTAQKKRWALHRANAAKKA